MGHKYCVYWGFYGLAGYIEAHNEYHAAVKLAEFAANWFKGSRWEDWRIEENGTFVTIELANGKKISSDAVGYIEVG